MGGALLATLPGVRFRKKSIGPAYKHISDDGKTQCKHEIIMACGLNLRDVLKPTRWRRKLHASKGKA